MKLHLWEVEGAGGKDEIHPDTLLCLKNKLFIFQTYTYSYTFM